MHCSASRSATPTSRSSPARRSAPPAEIARAADGPAFALSERHATWRAISADGWHVDVAALRAETITDDLAARDFTVNAIAIPLPGGDPIDPTGGLADAESRRLRAASERAFEEDPLRLLRAVRIAAHYDLRITDETASLARAAAPHAADPAGERQFAELRGIVAGPRPLEALRLMDELELTAVVLPELEALRGVVQNPNHHLDVLGHTLKVLEEWLAIESDLARLRRGSRRGDRRLPRRAARRRAQPQRGAPVRSPLP